MSRDLPCPGSVQVCVKSHNPQVMQLFAVRQAGVRAHSTAGHATGEKRLQRPTNAVVVCLTVLEVLKRP